MARSRKKPDETTEAPTAAAPELVAVRATVNLPGLPHGRTAYVDPKVPYIKNALKAGYLKKE